MRRDGDLLSLFGLGEREKEVAVRLFEEIRLHFLFRQTEACQQGEQILLLKSYSNILRFIAGKRKT